ncbi:CubicO group peptidase (beta-lactamase class C family) [Edaphobacter aggregans]|uniref:CubicO group peptidase (Beta-lactamase class C family) n=1 Tax=Edaphobacter aggregans TaxID=570835 RepID=A0A3R9PR44_9BACT|nr:serine hydrolase domain-containing protein [Edaphobacter aggregans]RSL15984.1 CubicO group peptidase (beta-lactamase class C family) [Edaphobacter aggregans]
MKSPVSVAVLFSFILAPVLLAQQPQPKPTIPSIQRLDGTRISIAEAERFAQKTLDSSNVTGAQIAIIDHGKRVWVHSFGLRDRDRQLPMDNDTAMWAASITKSVFACFVMQMVESGELNLDASIATYLPKPLPEYEKYKDLAGDDRWRKITPRILLSHTAGFANFTALEPDGKLHIHWEPGTRYAYSGEGINLLQFVIEQKTGRSLADMEQERLFSPLGMEHTSLVWQPKFAADIAGGHDPTGKYIGYSERTTPRAAGSMITTINDLTTFTEALLAGKVIRPETRNEMFKPVVFIPFKHQFPTLLDEQGAEGPSVGLAYGTGWGLLTKTKYGPAFFKEGHGDGAQNYMICFVRSSTCMILLTNSDNGEFAFRPLLETILGDTVTPWEWENYTPAGIMEARKHN